MTLPPLRPAIADLPDSEIVEVWRMGFSIPDVIGLWVGEGDLPTTRFICEAAAEALAAGKTFYTHKRGIPELRQALARYYARQHKVAIADDRIAVTSGGMSAIMLIAEALIGPGDNAACVTPVWPNIFSAIAIMGGEARHVPMQAKPAGWELDLDRLFAACDDRTKFVYLASPGNPTGWIMPEDQRRALLDFCRRRGLYLVADEVYSRLIYDRRIAPSFLEIAVPEDPLFVVNSFSKTWAMTGWRQGWMVMPAGLAETFDRLIEFNTSGGQPFLQAACAKALDEGEDWVGWMVERCRQGRELVAHRLAAMNRIRIVPNNASYYLMLEVADMKSAMDFCKRAVVEAKIGLAPGTAFGAGGEGFLRLCYAQSNDRLSAAMDRLAGFLATA